MGQPGKETERNGRKPAAIAVLLLLAATGVNGQARFSKAELSSLTAREIVERVDRMMRGDSSRGTVQMEIVTRRWTRTLSLEIHSHGTEQALIRVLEPKKEAGTATLKSGSDIWNYLPKIDRTIRVPTSMMMGSWMGSHFTNDDLVKESELVRDYEISMEFEGVRDEQLVWDILLTPYPDAPVVWGKVLYRVRQKDLMPVFARYFGEDGELKRTAVFSDYREMGGRLVPAAMKMIPEDKPEEYTLISYRNLEFDLPIPEGTFSLAALRR